MQKNKNKSTYIAKDGEDMNNAPQELIEYINNHKIIESIINNWFEDFPDLLLDKNNEPTLTKSIIANCMISYRKVMQYNINVKIKN